MDKIDDALKATNSSAPNAKSMIDRCHRGGDKRKFADNRKQRPIFASVNSWKNCEAILKAFRAAKSGVFVDYKYGPLTTERRNKALKRRKELIEAGEVGKCFIAFPAKLIGIPTGKDKYQLIEDFSKTKVNQYY